MSKTQDPLDTAINAVKSAVQAGADDADAYVRFANRLDMEVVNGSLENLRRATARGLGLRVTKERKTTLVHSTDFSDRSLDELASKALHMTGAMPMPRESVMYAAPQPVKSLPHPDPTLSEETIQVKEARLLDVEKAMTSIMGVNRSAGVSWHESDGVIALANSKGVELQSPFVQIELGAEAVAERNGQSYSGSRSVRVSSRSRLDHTHIGSDAGRRAVELLGACPVSSTKAPVIFTPYTGWAVLVYLTQPLRGDSIVEGRSYLAGKLGEQITANGVTVRDNSLIEEGVSRRSFDAEGTPTRDLILVESGKLANYLTDLRSAAKLGVPCGGNAVRDSYNARIEIGTTNCYMEPGGYTPEEIIAQTERGLMVTLLSGWWVGLSATNDVFSSAAMGFWIENGKVLHPVRGVSIGGSLREMLKSIDMIGNDLTFQERISVPTFRVAEMAISGI